MNNIENKTIAQLFNEHDNKYIIVGIDETEHWIDAVKKQIHNALGVYLISNEPTNLCSFEVNYPAIHIYDSFYRKDDFQDSEYLNECEMENFGVDNDTQYYSENLVPNEYYIVTHQNLVFDDETTKEEIAEYFLCNHVI